MFNQIINAILIKNETIYKIFMTQAIKYNSKTRNRRAQLTSMPEAISALLDAYKMTTKYQESYIVYSWDRVMGTPIAAKTTRLYVSKSVLHVIITSAALKDQLNMSKSRIIELLNQDAGAKVIKDIAFL